MSELIKAITIMATNRSQNCNLYGSMRLDNQMMCSLSNDKYIPCNYCIFADNNSNTYVTLKKFIGDKNV